MKAKAISTMSFLKRTFKKALTKRLDIGYDSTENAECAHFDRGFKSSNLRRIHKAQKHLVILPA